MQKTEDNITTKKSIKEWAADERPRERMLEHGKDTLSNAELIAILMGSGNKNETAVELAQHLLTDTHNNLIELSKLSINDLMCYKGIGEAKAVSIIAALELGKRRRQAEILELPSILSSRDAYEYLYPYISELDHEQFWIVLLNNRNAALRAIRIGIGGTTSASVDSKIIFRHAIETRGCTAIILGHNHPSDNTEPSQADISITQKIKKGAELFDIKVLDHIIVSNKTYYSFTDNGIL